MVGQKKNTKKNKLTTTKIKDKGLGTHPELPSQGHSPCQSALVVRLGDFCLDPPSRGHPSGSSVFGTSVWILRLRDIRLNPPSQGHPSRTSVS